ncbi:MAG: endopeptidase La [bacterium]|jgi:ATP-dependent Lon protease
MADIKSDQDVEVVGQDQGRKADNKTIMPTRFVFPSSLPIIPLLNRPFFPKMMVPLSVEDAALKEMLVKTAESSSKFIGLVLARNVDSEEDRHIPRHAAELFEVGVIAEILQINQNSSEGPLQVMVGVLDRFRIKNVITEDPYIVVNPDYVVETDLDDNDELRVYSLSVITAIKELLQLNPLFKEELNLFLNRSNIKEPGRLADFAAAMTTAGGKDLQDVLEAFGIRVRIEKVLLLLKKEIDISRLQVKINKQIEEKVNKQQRDFFLREQLKAIKKELGLVKEGKETELDEFKERLAKLTLTDEAQERINEEMNKLGVMEPHSPEFAVSRNYVDWLTSLPWGVFSKDSYDIKKAGSILNTDHYGLDDVKDRILEFLSVGILKGNISGSIICFVGPPGVGKTSIGQSIARSIGRQFYRFSVGGMRDEAEIKGHRRTYIGAMPGKFLQAIKVCKTQNPVIMLDEVDKIGASYHGDPASALLEVLDPEQNKDFLDHYLDVRFDLSNVLFICTANQLDTIPAPLLDRMEVIKLAGYILEEKIQIARKFLIPKQLKAHGLQSKQLMIADVALKEIIDGYAREPGVRGLENHIKKLCRKAAKLIVEKKMQRVDVTLKGVVELLGKRVFSETDPYKKPRVGVVMGLAWTSMGGSTLYIEATQVEAKNPGFKQTGQLGSVMVESSEIAYTYVRSFLTGNQKAKEFFEKNFIHLHVPAGATPKDGPSAGITMATALYSLAIQKPIRAHYAMTGELTLTGFVLPIGGLKEKTIAAKRAGVNDLIFPKENQKDFEELPAHIRKGLKPHFVATFKDVVELCFNTTLPAAKTGARRRKKA